MRLTVRIRDTLWDVRHRYAAGVIQSEYNDYTGTVVPRETFPWLDENWFVLTTGDSECPYRILHKDNVICGWKHHTDDGNVHIVEGKNKRKYVVTIADDGSASCNCLGFGYHKHCSHIGDLWAKVH